MPTDRQRIQGYIKPEIYEKFVAFKQSNRFSESEALGSILAQYFGLVPSPAIDTDAISALRADIGAQLEQLNDRISTLENDNQELRDLIAVTGDDAESVPEDQGITKEVLASIFDDDDPEENIEPIAEQVSPRSVEWISHAELARRLGISSETLRKHRIENKIDNYHFRVSKVSKNGRQSYEYQKKD